MRKLAVALTVAMSVLAGGCGVSEDTASDVEAKASAAAQQAEESVSALIAQARQVDWSKYPDQLRTKIDDFVAQDNCSGLNAELDKLDPAEDAQLTKYLKTAAEKAGCA